jgi:2-polyprenyl-6-methoxyphenol hydroxylase-like FAD-dependent oxidoreductase
MSIFSMNYPVCFLDRQALLRILSEHVFDLNKLLLNKRVETVDHTTNEVVVHCTDGSSYHGDIVAGADGVASKVRREMWRAADTLEPGVISREEKRSMYAFSHPTLEEK